MASDEFDALHPDDHIAAAQAFVAFTGLFGQVRAFMCDALIYGTRMAHTRTLGATVAMSSHTQVHAARSLCAIALHLGQMSCACGSRFCGSQALCDSSFNCLLVVDFPPFLLLTFPGAIVFR